MKFTKIILSSSIEYKKYTVVILLFLHIILFAACEEDDYKKAVYENTIQSYNKYLQENPDSENTLEIKNRKENIYYVEALNSDTLSYYKEYLTKYPSGRYVTDIKKLYEEKLFEIASDEDSIESYKKYLALASNSIKIDEARKRLSLLAYYEVLANDTVEAYETYLEEYSEARYIDNVREKLKTLKESILLNSRKNIEHNSIQRNKILKKLNELYWSRTDQYSLISLEVLLHKDVNATIANDAKKQIDKLIKNSKIILKEKKYEIQNVKNNQSKEVKFLLLTVTDAFISMTGEKSDKFGLGGAIEKNVWLDSGELKGPSQYIPDSGIPIGGELTNMLDTKYLTLASGSYTLRYKTDSGRAWDDFNNNPPLNNKWGITLHFLEFGKDLLPQIQVLNKYFSDSSNRDSYIYLEKTTKEQKIKSIEDQKSLKKLSSRIFDFDFSRDIYDIDQYITQNSQNNFNAILEYSLIYKKLMRMYKDIKFSPVNVSDGIVQDHRPGWFEQAAEDEGVARTFTDENEAAEAILSGDGGYFTRVRAKQYYFSGYIENMSDSVIYNLDIRCDFNFRTIKEVGVWRFRKRIENTFIKSKHFKIKSIKPNERRAYACKIQSNSGGAINMGMIGGSASLFIDEWQVNVTELKDDDIASNILQKQEKVLKEAGLHNIDFNGNNVVTPTRSVNRVEVHTNNIEFQ